MMHSSAFHYYLCLTPRFSINHHGEEGEEREEGEEGGRKGEEGGGKEVGGRRRRGRRRGRGGGKEGRRRGKRGEGGGKEEGRRGGGGEEERRRRGEEEGGGGAENGVKSTQCMKTIQTCFQYTSIYTVRYIHQLAWKRGAKWQNPLTESVCLGIPLDLQVVCVCVNSSN